MSLARVPGLEITSRTTLEELAVILDALDLRVHVSLRRGRWEAVAFRREVGSSRVQSANPRLESPRELMCSGAGETIADALSAAISEACEGAP